MSYDSKKLTCNFDPICEPGDCEIKPEDSPKNVDSVYFSHPIKSYGTPDELLILDFLKKEFDTVINPAEHKTNLPHTGCKDCMRLKMKEHYFKLIDRCKSFAIWDPINSCGVNCEIHYAAQQDKELLFIELQPDKDVDLDNVSLQEYHYMSEVERI